MKLGMTARIGAGFILFCSIIAFFTIAYFLYSEGFSLDGGLFLIACLGGGYLFAYLAFKGKTPPIFKWLE